MTWRLARAWTRRILMALNARVLIDGPSELVFDYGIPAGMNVRPGCRVRVPLRRKSAAGTVLSVGEADGQADFALRELEALVEPEPLITPVLLETGRWIADYYGCSIESVVRSLLPEAVRTEENSAKTRRIAIVAAEPDAAALEKLAKRAPRQHAILSLLMHAEGKRLPVADLGDGSAATLKALEKAGMITLEAEEVRRDPDGDMVEEILESKPLALNPEQAAALEAVCQAVAEPQAAKPPVRGVRHLSGVRRSNLHRLERRRHESRRRDPVALDQFAGAVGVAIEFVGRPHGRQRDRRLDPDQRRA